MQTKTRNFGKLVRLATIIVALLTISLNANAYYSHNRHNARQVINKTAYIIDQAYQVADYYNYWSGEYISRAVHYNDYAEKQFYRRNYRTAIYFSLKAREYALMVIDGCDDYWDSYYYENYGWSRIYGYNPYYTGGHGNHYGHYGDYYNNYHNNHGNNSNYNPNQPNNHNNPRGTNERPNSFDPNKPNNNGTSTGHFSNGTRLKNIDSENYFDKDERELLKNLPDDNSMENQFKAENKDVRFDNSTIKNNPALINQNRTKAEAFKKNTPEASRKSINLAEPKRIDEINSKKINEQNLERSKEIKTNKPNELKPINNNRVIETKPINNNNNKVIESKPIKTNNSDFRNFETNKPIKQTNSNNDKINQERSNRDNNIINNSRKTRETKTINQERKTNNRTINTEKKNNNTNQERKINNKTENKRENQEKEKSNLRTR